MRTCVHMNACLQIAHWMLIAFSLSSFWDLLEKVADRSDYREFCTFQDHFQLTQLSTWTNDIV